ncbi:ABC transporter permease [Zoogloea sp. LCSB751]|uniref:ABC transporter permease n=1 Tax=Zoogloea sp. LCSB751 TaxID=1965277 RepID=UPI0009A528F0|nr:ABC transporter permease [Zoogloea sp. LCSB751]
MKTLLPLALASAWNRRLSLALTVFSITLAVTLLIAVTRVRDAAQTGFAQAVAGVDLVVGPRGSPMQLLLHAVFHLGDATHTMRWQSYRTLATDPQVAWSIPLALGDSHRGFPVLGTTPEYFRHLRYGQQHPLGFSSGQPFSGLFEAVVGAEIAARLGYRLGELITLHHGTVHLDELQDKHRYGAEHTDKPFRIVGILSPTATPVDRTIHVSLASLEAIHLNWQGGLPLPGLDIPPQLATKFDLTPKTLDAVLIGLHQRTDVLRAQRQIANFTGEPLMAILPSLIMDELWQLVGSVERSLHGLAWLVVGVGLAGMAAVIIAGLGERRRELAILRSVGAGPWHIVALVMLEGGTLTAAGLLTGLGFVEGAGYLFAPWVNARLSLDLATNAFSADELRLIAGILATGLLTSLLPGWRASRMSLADGLIPRL